MVTIFIEGEPPQNSTLPPLSNALVNSMDIFDTSTTLKGNLEQAFTKLFEQLGLPKQMHSVVMSGTTSNAAIQFAKSVKKCETVLLLIDTDGKTPTEQLQQIVHTRLKREMPTLADPSVYDKNVFFMLRECEAWFLYSDIIARWFKTQQTDLNLQQKQGEDSSFHLQNALNGQKPSEIISPDKVLDRILKACFETKRKGVIIPKGYKSKMKDGTDFLLASKILDLQDRCTEVDRLVARLRTF